MTSSNEFKIAALINAYNDAEFIERTINSVREKVGPELLVIADGAYQQFPYGEFPASTDGTKAIAKREADIFLGCNREEPWRGEAHKRNALLGCVPQDLWCLRIDADEEIEKFNTEQLDRDEDVLIAKMKNYKPDGSYTERQRSLVFRPAHDWFYKQKDALFKGSKSIAQLKRVSTDQIVIGHHPYARPDERLDKRMEYRDRVNQHTTDPRED